MPTGGSIRLEIKDYLTETQGWPGMHRTGAEGKPLAQ
jgi:hypothetical protein